MLRRPVAGLSHGQERDRAGDEDQHVEDHVALCHLLHPVGGQRVDEASQERQSGHHADDGAGRRNVSEVRAYGHSCQ